MGHYASEMQCDKCGNLRCTCPRDLEQTDTYFYVDDDFTVMTGEEYVKKHKIPTDLRMLSLYAVQSYKTREQAEHAALNQCEMAVEQARTRLTWLKHALKVIRPWEKK
jgi:hypothetical protein